MDAEDIADMARRWATRTPLVTNDGRWIVIRCPHGGTYDIEVSRCNSPEKQLSWVAQLSDKSWITVDHIRDFILAARVKRTAV